MPIAFHWLASLFFAIPAAAVAEPVKTSPEWAALSVDPAFSFPDRQKARKDEEFAQRYRMPLRSRCAKPVQRFSMRVLKRATSLSMAGECSRNGAGSCRCLAVRKAVRRARPGTAASLSQASTRPGVAHARPTRTAVASSALVLTSRTRAA